MLIDLHQDEQLLIIIFLDRAFEYGGGSKI
jgi:hypothetical protein